jgi:hypothetical protein
MVNRHSIKAATSRIGPAIYAPALVTQDTVPTHRQFHFSEARKFEDD